MSSEIQDDKEFYVSYQLLNTGKTPALDETSEIKPYLWYGFLPLTEFKKPETVISAAIIAPGETHVRNRTVGWIPPKDLVARYKSKTALLYVHAIVRYQDAFKKPHWTRLCVFHTCGDPLDAFAYCRAGNETDQE